MTTDRDFDGIAKAWLAEGPAELSDRVLVAVVDDIHQTRQRHSLRVPWRFPTMHLSGRTSALLLIGALAAAAGLVILSGIGGTAPTPSPTSFTSPRYGYSIHYPSGWIASAATTPWLAGADTPYGDPALDTIGTTDARLAIASQPLAGTFYLHRQLFEGQMPNEWLVAHCGSPGPTAASCGSRILIGGQPGRLHVDGAPATGGTVATGGVIFDAAVVYGDRGYAFTLDGNVDRALFEGLLASVEFDPDGAIDLPPLTKTFTSPTYGYSIGLPEGFITTPAKSKWDPDANTGDQDMIGMPNLDLFVMVASAAIPAGTTFDEWFAIHFPPTAGVDGGCNRDDPATWPPIQIGNAVGRLRSPLCGNSVWAFVEVGGRAYEFSWSTQVAETHHTLGDWKEMLKSVTFDPGAAKS